MADVIGCLCGETFDIDPKRTLNEANTRKRKVRVMSRSLGSPLRPLAVWSVASTAVAVALVSVSPAWSEARSASGAAAVSDLVVAACATGLALALFWLWLVTTATVLGLLRGRTAPGGATRRLDFLDDLERGIAVAGAVARAAEIVDHDLRTAPRELEGIGPAQAAATSASETVRVSRRRRTRVRVMGLILPNRCSVSSTEPNICLNAPSPRASVPRG